MSREKARGKNLHSRPYKAQSKNAPQRHPESRWRRRSRREIGRLAAAWKAQGPHPAFVPERIDGRPSATLPLRQEHLSAVTSVDPAARTGGGAALNSAGIRRRPP